VQPQATLLLTQLHLANHHHVRKQKNVTHHQFNNSNAASSAESGEHNHLEQRITKQRRENQAPSRFS